MLSKYRRRSKMSKTAIVTGATSGMGSAFARRFAADGYNLIITGRRSEIIRKFADDLITQRKVEVKVMIGELSDDKNIDALLDMVSADQNIEILVNNAGYSGGRKQFADIIQAECEQMIKVHQIVPTRLIRAVLPQMLKRKKGAIINVASIGAFMPLPGSSIYCPTKAFLALFSETLYLELKDKGIKVQALCPGAVDTDFFRSFPPEKRQSQLKQYRAASPEAIVDYSLKSLNKGKVLCLPPGTLKTLHGIYSFLPRSILYKTLIKAAARMGE
jgi:uncharacterized protein